MIHSASAGEQTEKGISMSEEAHRPNSAPGILVVDDDPFLLPLLRTVLTCRGFQVWACRSGKEAHDIYREHHRSITVVLLDVCMPGLDGPNTLLELRRIDPAIRFCFMSGYTGAYTIDDLLGLGAVRFFEKPFEIQPFTEGLWQVACGETCRQSA
jgi:two-component system cell cycle sensor histidine kinase/response regulator CckA